MLWIVGIVAAVVFIVFGLFYALKLEFKVLITSGEADIILTLKFFYKLMGMKIYLRAYFRQGERLELFQIRKNGTRKKVLPNENNSISRIQLFFKSLPIKNYKKWLKLKSLNTTIKLGTGDAKSTAILCGLISNIIYQSAYYLFYENNPIVTNEIIPEFEKKYFLLKMQGIINLVHAKIITATIKEFSRAKSVAMKGDSNE